MKTVEITKRARIRSVDSSFNKDTKKGSALASILIKGICVPIYATLSEIPVNLIPYNGEYLFVKYIIKNHKIIITALERSNGDKVLCSKENLLLA